jgi:hypothetical protein
MMAERGIKLSHTAILTGKPFSASAMRMLMPLVAPF